MDEGTTYVALDDSKRKVVAAILRAGASEPEQREFPKEPHSGAERPCEARGPQDDSNR
jgi:hypothetical protein